MRGDVLYGFFRPRTQASIDLTLYIVFFLPGIVALTWAGWTYRQRVAGDPRADLQRRPAAGLPVQVRRCPSPARVLLLQGLVEIVRCVICLRDGDWPAREDDVEEVDVDKLKEMVHVKDADIEAAGQAASCQRRRQERMKIRKELWFGFILMALIVAAALGMLLSVPEITNGHIGLLMLSLVVVAIMLGFPDRLHADGHGHDVRLLRLPLGRADAPAARCSRRST